MVNTWKLLKLVFSSTPTGTINDSTDVSLGICTLPVVKVERAQLGIAVPLLIQQTIL